MFNPRSWHSMVSGRIFVSTRRHHLQPPYQTLCTSTSLENVDNDEHQAVFVLTTNRSTYSYKAKPASAHGAHRVYHPSL